ncbi:MAG: hypothetical protein ACRDQZ_19490 [Mycobacteriales bacterium]
MSEFERRKKKKIFIWWDPFSWFCCCSRLERKLDEQHAEEMDALGKILLRLPKDNTPVKLEVKLQGGIMGTTPGSSSIQEGLLIGASDVEFNAEGDQVAAADPAQLTYAVDDPTIAKIVTPADDPAIPVGQARVLGLKVGTVNVTSTDNALTPPLVSDPVALEVTLDPVAKKLVVTLAAVE